MEERVNRRRSRRVWLWSALGVLVIAGTIGGVLVARNAGGNGKKKNDKAGPPPAPVELSVVHRGSISTWLQTTTTLEAQNSAVLVARGQGEVVQVLVEEGQWVERGAAGHRLDRGDRPAIGLDGQHRARLGALAVDVDSAGTAVAGVATDMRAGQSEVVTQEMHQEEARLDVGLVGLAVDGDRDVLCRHRGTLPTRSRARARRPCGAP